MTVFFRNPGLLPLEAITTLGISVKETDSPIGRFGTGLKYTIAGILRMRESISIEVGDKKFLFSSQQREVRGKVFDFVLMEDIASGAVRELGFTTDLGKHWQPWMFIRELWSNMKDEGGTCGKGTGGPLASNETRILIQGAEIEEAFNRRHEFLLENFEPTYANPFAAYSPSPSDTIFFQGIRVCVCDKPLLGTYDLKDPAGLTEDRTLPEYAVRSTLGEFFYNCSDMELYKKFITCFPNYFEHDLHLPAPISDSPQWNMLRQLWEESPMTLSEPARILASQIFKPSRDSITFTLSSVEQAKFKKALAFLHFLGYDEDIEWRFVDPKDDEAYGFVSQGRVYICRRAFTSGTQFLAQVMLEEYLHYIKGFADSSRRFQDFLFSEIVRIGEELQGEPL